MLAQWSDGSYAPFTGGTVNPLPMIEQGVGGNNIRQNGTLKASAALEYKPVQWLTLEVKAAPQFTAVKTISSWTSWSTTPTHTVRFQRPPMRNTTPSTRRSPHRGTAITMRPRRRPVSSGATASNCSSAHLTKNMTITASGIPAGVRLSRLRGHQRRRRQRVQGQLRQPDPDGAGLVLRPHQL